MESEQPHAVLQQGEEETLLIVEGDQVKTWLLIVLPVVLMWKFERFGAIIRCNVADAEENRTSFEYFAFRKYWKKMQSSTDVLIIAELQASWLFSLIV